MPATLFDAVLGTGVYLRQCQAATYSSGMQLEILRSSGAILPSEITQKLAEPTCSLTTSDIATVTAEIGIAYGLCLTSSTVAMVLASQGCGGAMGDGNHTVITGAKGFAHIASIAARQGEAVATANIEWCWLSSDGFASPITISHANNLAATAFVDTYRFGGVSLDGTALTGCVGFTINPGTTYQKLYKDGGVYPYQTMLGEITPTIDLTFQDQAKASAFGSVVNSASLLKTATNLTCLLALNQDGGTVASSGGISFSFADGYAHVETVQSNGRSPGEVTVRVTGLSLAVS
jgi:hypothetical protein